MQLESKLEEVLAENRLLREKIDLLVRHLYGSKSERLDPNQLSLLEVDASKKAEAPVAESVEADTGAKPKPRAQRKTDTPRVPGHLSVHEEFVDPDEVKVAPHLWRLIGEEVSEQLDYQPAQFYKKRLRRRKYVRRDEPFSTPVIAPLHCLQERCLATPELIAHVVVSKYCDHLPLYRQEQINRTRFQVETSRQTLLRWVDLAAHWLEVIYREMLAQQMRCRYLQVDETPIRYLDPGKGKTGKGYFWVTSEPDGDVLFHWHAGRSANCLLQTIDADFKGTLQCDGYKAYPSFQKQRAGPVQLAGCWAHARRKFFEARELNPVFANFALTQIRNLYRIERRLRQTKASASLRAVVRSVESAPILDRIKRAIMLKKSRTLPENNLGKAVNYAINQWSQLEVFIENGDVEIDQNLVENAIRPTKLGAKNWLFIGAENAGKTSAILFSIIESAKRHGIEPYAYICYLLNTLPKASNTDIPSLTPAEYAKIQLRKVA